MLKDDRMISILSGVVVMLALGVLAQRADMLGGVFGGAAGDAVLRADRVVVDSGVLTRLDVLRNDSGLPDGAGDRLAVVRAPGCGQVFVQDGALQYLAEDACVGSQSVAYGIGDAAGAPAEVALIVRRTADSRAPDDKTADAPSEEPADAPLAEAAAGTAEPDAPLTGATGAPGPAVVASAPEAVLVPPIEPAPPVMPEALRRAPAADHAGIAAATPRAGAAPDRAPSAPARVPVPLIGMESATASEVPGDAGHSGGPPPLPVAIAPIYTDISGISGTVPGDVTGGVPGSVAGGVPGHVSGLGPEPSPEPAPAGAELAPASPIAALGPATGGLVQAEPEAEPLAGPEPDAVIAAPTLRAPGASGLGDTGGDIGGPVAAPTLPERGLERGVVPAGAPPALAPPPAGVPAHPATAPGGSVLAALGAPEAALPDPTDPETDPAGMPLVRRGTARVLAPSDVGADAPGPGPGHFVAPAAEAEPLAAATEPAPAEPARLAALDLPGAASEAPLARADLSAPALRIPSVAIAIDVPAGAAARPTVPERDADPLAAAREPEPARVAALDAPGDIAGAPAPLAGLAAPVAAATATALAPVAAPGPAPAALPVPDVPAEQPVEEPAAVLAALPPAAEACTATPRVSVVEHPAAFTEVQIEAPCLPGSTVRLAHEGLLLGARLTDDGRGRILVPGVRASARARVDFADGSSVPLDLHFRDVERVQRLILAWDAPVEFGVHAFEGGARERGEPGHVGPTHPRSFDEVRVVGGGFLTSIPSVGEGTHRLGIYTLWLSRRGPSGIVRMELDFVSRREAGGAGACGDAPHASPEYVLLLSAAGEPEPMIRSRIASLDCAAVTSLGDGFVTGALPNLVVSTR